ncbi:MAG: type II toxin-antitoxin system RelE/ParE family toxin [Candidatus Eiseniibacteriota bacterium]
MPRTEVLLYRDEDGGVPLRDWLDDLEPRAQAKCLASLKRLEDLGHELRRPEADYLRDRIYELRTRIGRVHLRMLYVFHGRQAVVVSHGFAKEGEVPAREIEVAIDRRSRFKGEGTRHALRGGE